MLYGAPRPEGPNLPTGGGIVVGRDRGHQRKACKVVLVSKGGTKLRGRLPKWFSAAPTARQLQPLDDRSTFYVKDHCTPLSFTMSARNPTGFDLKQFKAAASPSSSFAKRDPWARKYVTSVRLVPIADLC